MMGSSNSTTEDCNLFFSAGVETQEQSVMIENSYNEKLVGILQETGSKEVVVVCHGYRSCKDRIPMVNLAAAFAIEGITAFRFDFAGNGESEGSFQYGNYYREVNDLRAVVQYFEHEKRSVAAIIGHSKGRNVVVSYASKFNDVHNVVNISGRFNLKRGIEGRLGKDYMLRIKKHGFIDVANRKGEIHMSRVIEESLMDHLTTTNTSAACQLIPQNWRVLSIHGSVDKIVPMEDAMEFAKHILNLELHIVNGNDHKYTFHQNELASIVLDFVKNISIHL
ncbi:putative uncharacterized protein YDL057W [Bidens hawaiensis]|uniref:putative uncharacterized protein YDL057W n=1 Tax=Bidens hawaiensis TaxID=980011 RepID=UPI00404B978F